MAENPAIRAGLVFDDRYLEHNPGLKQLPGGVPYPWVEPELHWSNHRLVQRTKQLVDISGAADRLKMIPPRMATRDELERFHTPGYVARIERISQEGCGRRGRRGADRSRIVRRCPACGWRRASCN